MPDNDVAAGGPAPPGMAAYKPVRNPQEWRSGVGGGQCDHCGRTTIVRPSETDFLGTPTEWTCRPCSYGEDDYEDDEE